MIFFNDPNQIILTQYWSLPGWGNKTKFFLDITIFFETSSFTMAQKMCFFLELLEVDE